MGYVNDDIRMAIMTFLCAMYNIQLYFPQAVESMNTQCMWHIYSMQMHNIWKRLKHQISNDTNIVILAQQMQRNSSSCFGNILYRTHVF